MKNNNALIQLLAESTSKVLYKRIDPRVAREVSAMSRTIISASKLQLEYNVLALQKPTMTKVQFLEG